MTDEQYQKALDIHKRIGELKQVKECIKRTEQHRLRYARNSGDFGNSWCLVSEWDMRNISDILDKHDKMIRAEIDEEIERLIEEIKNV